VYSTGHLLFVARGGVLERWVNRPDRLRFRNRSKCHAWHPPHPSPLLLVLMGGLTGGLTGVRHPRETNRVLGTRHRGR